jgi:hypothetical protein
LSGSEKVADVANSATSGSLVASSGVASASAQQKVSSLSVVAASANGNAGVVEGVQNGTAVAVVTSRGSTGLFTPTSKLLSWANGLYIETSEAGSAPGVINEIDISGIAEPSAASIAVVARDGSVKELAVNDMSDGSKAFAIALNPNDFKPAAVVSYDKSGRELARKDLPASLLTPFKDVG